jgi:DNA-binding cell septation regulator SpoVG
MITVTVVDMQESENKHVLASATVNLMVVDSRILINDFRIMRNNQGGLWVAPPFRAVQRREGPGFLYYPLIVLSSSLGREIKDKVLAAFSKWEQEQQSRG